MYVQSIDADYRDQLLFQWTASNTAYRRVQYNNNFATSQWSEWKKII